MGTVKGVAALQEWARRIVANEPYSAKVTVENMSGSWKNGLAFCAIIHHFRPDLIDFNSLDPGNIFGNNLLAFTVAEKQLGVTSLLDAADMTVLPRPDRLSIITYVAQLHEYFKSQSPVTPPKGVHVEKKYGYDSLKRIQMSPIVKVDQVDIGVKAQLCHACGQQVYLMERLVIDDCTYHRVCFRCVRCKKQLKVGLYRDYYRQPNDQLLVDVSNTQQRHYECFSHEREHIAYEAIVKKKLKTDDGAIHHIKPAVIAEVDQLSVEISLPRDSIAPKRSPIPPPVPEKPKIRLSDLIGSQNQPETETVAAVVETHDQQQPVYDMTHSMTLSNTTENLSVNDNQPVMETAIVAAAEMENNSQLATVSDVSQPTSSVSNTTEMDDNPIPLPRRHNRSGATTPLARENSVERMDKLPQKQIERLERKLLTSPPPVFPKPSVDHYGNIDAAEKPVPLPRSKKAPPKHNGVEATKAEVVEEYPVDKNPFGDEEESKQNDSKGSLNPFGSGSESEEEIPPIRSGVKPQPNNHRVSMPVLPSVKLREPMVTDRSSLRSSAHSLTRRSKRPAPLPPPPSVTPPEPPIHTGTLPRPSVVPPPPPKVDSDKIGRKKRPAPPRPLPPRRSIQIEKMLSAEERQLEFDKIEFLRVELEQKSKALEEKLRSSEDEDWSKSPQLMSEWFMMINEKNRLVRWETDLVYMEKLDELNQLHSDLEFELRCSMERPESEKSDDSTKQEDEWIARLTEVVDEKSRLVETQVDEKIRQSLEEKNISDFEKRLRKGLKLKTLKPKDKDKEKVKVNGVEDKSAVNESGGEKKKKFHLHLGNKDNSHKKHPVEVSKEI